MKPYSNQNETKMPSITIKNIPDDVYDRIKQRATDNRRSINSEIIECLDQITHPRQVNAEIVRYEARQLRESIKGKIKESDIKAAIRRGRA
jgi:plasmid stability protein